MVFLRNWFQDNKLINEREEKEMLDIHVEKKDNELIVKMEGRLDTLTSHQLENELRTQINGISKLVLDMNKVEYVSSAGLRVILSAQKVMNKQGKMIVVGVSDLIMEIFEVTGFVDILTIE